MFYGISGNKIVLMGRAGPFSVSGQFYWRMTKETPYILLDGDVDFVRWTAIARDIFHVIFVIVRNFAH